LSHLYNMLALATLVALGATGCMAHHTGALPGEPEATYAQIAGARVRYLDTGEPGDKRPTVVLLHGFASSMGNWVGVIPALKADHRVIALDLKGFGWTDRPPGDYSPQAQAKLILELMTQRGVEQAALVAHSWGSSVALALTLDSPERVSRIALYDAWVYEEQLPTFFLWARAGSLGELLFWLFYKEQPALKVASAFYDQRYVTQELVDEVERQINRPGTSAAALAAVRGQRYDLVQARYKGIDKPVLLMWGREDAVTPLWVGERLVRELPDARLVVYPGCGHFPMIEALAASNRELKAFLDAGVTTAATKTAPAPQAEVSP
jgi:pimeloyl-ACP methyl ester carboxylesterase